MRGINNKEKKMPELKTTSFDMGKGASFSTHILNGFDVSIIPLEQLAEVAKAFEEGAKKYSRDDWKRAVMRKGGVGDFTKKFKRHFHAYVFAEKKDMDSGLHPLAHAIANLMILMWADMEWEKNLSNRTSEK